MCIVRSLHSSANFCLYKCLSEFPFSYFNCRDAVSPYFQSTHALEGKLSMKTYVQYIYIQTRTQTQVKSCDWSLLVVCLRTVEMKKKARYDLYYSIYKACAFIVSVNTHIRPHYNRKMNIICKIFSFEQKKKKRRKTRKSQRRGNKKNVSNE